MILTENDGMINFFKLGSFLLLLQIFLLTDLAAYEPGDVAVAKEKNIQFTVTFPKEIINNEPSCLKISIKNIGSSDVEVINDSPSYMPGVEVELFDRSTGKLIERTSFGKSQFSNGVDSIKKFFPPVKIAPQKELIVRVNLNKLYDLESHVGTPVECSIKAVYYNHDGGSNKVTRERIKLKKVYEKIKKGAKNNYLKEGKVEEVQDRFPLSNKDENLMLEVMVPDEIYSNEPCLFKIRLTNLTSKSIWIDERKYFPGVEIFFYAKNFLDKPRRYTDLGSKMISMQDLSGKKTYPVKEIKPGSYLEFQVDMQRFYLMKHTQKFVFHIKAHYYEDYDLDDRKIAKCKTIRISHEQKSLGESKEGRIFYPK